MKAPVYRIFKGRPLATYYQLDNLHNSSMINYYSPFRSLTALVSLTLLVSAGCKDKTAQATDQNEVVAEEVQNTDRSIQIKAGPLPNLSAIEHATAVLEWEGTTIYIDPTGGKAAFENFPLPDLILITDIHGDHFNLETLEELETAQAKLLYLRR